MRILSDIDYQELTDPDLTAGYTMETVWASPEAYATIDGITKHALADEDYEVVQMYHQWTEQELAERERAASAITIDELAAAVAELAAIMTEV